MPLDSQAPRLPGVVVGVDVGRALVGGLVHLERDGRDTGREVVAATAGRSSPLGSVEPTGNCWLEPGSSVRYRLLAVDSMLSG